MQAEMAVSKKSNRPDSSLVSAHSQVIDEADTIFAEGWGEELEKILGPLRAKPEPTNVVLVSATMTKVCQTLHAFNTVLCWFQSDCD